MSQPSAEASDRVHSALETGGAALRSELVTTSWQRSLRDHRVDPGSLEAPRILTAQELIDARGPVEDLIAVAREESDRLHAIVGKVGYVVLLTSAQGVVVEVRGDPLRADEFAYWGVWKGGVWAEDVEGTNGIGTCIAELRPVTVHRTQHFRARNTSLSCCGAPVFGPDGSLAAVLDVSSIDPEVSERSHALALSVTMDAARAIEERLFRQTFRRMWMIAVAPSSAAQKPFLLALDDDQRIVGADRNARSILGVDAALPATLSLWAFFERLPSAFRAASNDVTVQLTRVGDERPWRAVITAPQPADARVRIVRLPRAANPALSPRERSILDLIGQGRSNKEIARVLGISPETVKSHLKNLFLKLGVERRAQAIYQARIAE